MMETGRVYLSGAIDRLTQMTMGKARKERSYGRKIPKLST
jgi:hypothetical protein